MTTTPDPSSDAAFDPIPGPAPDPVYDRGERLARIQAAQQRVRDLYGRRDPDAAALVFNGYAVAGAGPDRPTSLRLVPKSAVSREDVDIDIAGLLDEADLDVIAARLVGAANDKIKAGLIPRYWLAPRP